MMQTETQKEEKFLDNGDEAGGLDVSEFLLCDLVHKH